MEELFRYQQPRQSQRLSEEQKRLIGLSLYPDDDRTQTPKMHRDKRRSRAIRTALVLAVLGCGLLSLTGPPPSEAKRRRSPAVSAIPERARWEAQMVTYGRQACEALRTSGWTLDEALAQVYYDQIRVMYQLADYTGDPTWNACATTAVTVYRDGYVLPNGDAVPGYWNFTTGLRKDVARTGHPASRTAVVQLSQSAMYAGDFTPLEWTQSSARSREVAYAILSYIDAHALGEPARPRRSALVDQAYGHLDEWFVWYTWRDTREPFSPFMVGLTAHSLIRDWEQTHDARLVPALRRAADWLWSHAWDPVGEAMMYDVNGVDGPASAAPDLNLLIAPMYAFLYWQTGLTQYRDQADALFAGGVRQAWLGDGKHFDQNYWWSFDYVRWREAR